MGVFKDKKVQDCAVYLYGRWLDEREYEDIKEYGQVVAPHMMKLGVKFKKMNKRPFGFTFEVDGRDYQITVNSREMRVMQVKK